jgi:hypothetical protein
LTAARAVTTNNAETSLFNHLVADKGSIVNYLFAYKCGYIPFADVPSVVSRQPSVGVPLLTAHD